MPSEPTPHVFRPPPPTDFVSALIWPKLLHAAGLALRPARIGLAVFALVLVAVVDRLPGLWNREGAGAIVGWLTRVPDAATRVRAGLASADGEQVASGLGEIFFRVPRGLFAQAPFSTALILLLALPVWSVFTLAICRSCAMEFGAGERQTWVKSLAFAWSRWLSGVGVMLTPWVTMYAVALALAVLGWLTLNWTGVQVVAAALFVVAIVLGSLGVIAVLGLVLGGPMLVPTVACESADAIDALQRVYAYVIARPARLAAYLLVLMAVGLLCVGSVGVVAHLVTTFSLRASTVWVHEPLASILRGEVPREAVEPAWSRDTAASMVRFWLAIPALLAAGYLVSYVCCAGTLLYLGMRRLCDGQEMGELWQPGMVPGTYAPEQVAGEDPEE